MKAQAHEERKHSDYSASGSERWHNCPGSVALSKGIKRMDSVWSLEGTKAHEVLEEMLSRAIKDGGKLIESVPRRDDVPHEMAMHGMNAANFILSLWKKQWGWAEVLVETRIRLDFIHPEMFGTFDGAVIDHFGTLHVLDYKYGQHMVSPVENLQMIFYALGLAHLHHWNFKRVRLWIIQPRVRGYDGPSFWEIGILELKKYVGVFEKAVDRVHRFPNKYREGSWCHFCPAKRKCPLKREERNKKAIGVFKNYALTFKQGK